jgi:uncharacterized membrane protein
MKFMTPLSLVATLVLLFLLPLLFGQIMAVSLVKLHLSPGWAVALITAIVVGSFINIPVKRIQRDEPVAAHPLAVIGVFNLWPELRSVRQETVIAINVGGCLVPAGLALYELAYLTALGGYALFAAVIAALVNITICYFLARPTPGIGILIPGLVPALVAAMLALILLPENAAPVAFVAGIAGPLIGADLLHLKEIKQIAVGMASIGGAGTFDGIVLSGIIAAYLA